MKTADLYIRVRTDEQAEKGYSLNLQKQVLEKYCEINNIIIRKVFTEDFSAKSFNRPEWRKLIEFSKKNRKEPSLLLFTRWDRFSRNTSDAYQTIAMLRKMGIETQAIEQPLDLKVPENKLMLAIYLTIPEIENDRKALSTKAGLRQAKKEGRVTGPAPLGYKNRTSEEGKKYVVTNESEASIVKWIFDQVERDVFSSENIWHIAREKGMKCSKNNFYCVLKNPFYHGKIIIQQYQKEEAYLVDGRHRPLITEDQFNKVQNTLSKRLRQNGLCIFAIDELILRGFLFCPRCGIKLTASAQRKNKLARYNYQCHSKCKFRTSAGYINERFIEEIKSCFVDKNVICLFIKTIMIAYKNHSQPSVDKRNIVKD